MNKHNPVKVSANALNTLPNALKEQVVVCQQRFEPLPLYLQEALDKAKESASVKN